MILKLKKPIVFYDCESTGGDHSKDRLTEIYAFKEYPDGTSKTLYLLINPEMEISKFIEDLTGITNEKVKSAPKFREVSKEIYIFMTEGNPDLCGYGINFFDNSFLAEKFREERLMFPLPEQKSIDIADIYRKMNPRSLSDAYKRYVGEEHKDAHTAKGDVDACRSILEGQISEHKKDIGETTDSILEYLSGAFKVVDVSRKLTLNEKGEVVFNIGKSKGIRVKDDEGFAMWMIGQPWITPNTVYYIKKELGMLDQANDKQDDNDDELGW